MARTNTLRALIVQRLETLTTPYGIEEISFRRASDDLMYPHIVFDFVSVTPTDMEREDTVLDIHIWTKDQAVAYNLKDAVIDLFSFSNLPQETILPTFYFTSAGSIDDPDKSICHEVVRFSVQNFERS